MGYTFEQLCRFERTMRSASCGLRQVGVEKQVSEDLRSLEHVLSVVRQAGQTLSNKDAPAEDKESAMACIYDGLFR